MKNTIKSSLVHTFKGLTYPLLSENYFNLFLITLVTFILTPKFLEPLWFIFSLLGVLTTVKVEQTNAKFDDVVLKFFDKKDFKYYLKITTIVSLSIGIFTNIDFISSSFLSGLLIFVILGQFIIYSLSYITEDAISTKYLKKLEEEWLLFFTINILFTILSVCIYTPILIFMYIMTLYSMTFEEIKKEE